jgi:hypothetical protein
MVNGGDHERRTGARTSAGVREGLLQGEFSSGEVRDMVDAIRWTPEQVRLEGETRIQTSEDVWF